MTSSSEVGATQEHLPSSPQAAAEVAAEVAEVAAEVVAEFPFSTPEGSDARMFIQWKGTEVCLDFTCACGQSGHLDGGFAYYVQCPSCEATYQMGTQVIAKRVVGDLNVPAKVLDIS